MEIRSLTLFDEPGKPIRDEALGKAELFSEQSQKIFTESNFTVQTRRYATPPFPVYLGSDNSDFIIPYALELENTLGGIGFDYVALGPALPTHPESYSIIPDLIKATERVFCSGLMTGSDNEISLPAVRACGDVIHQLAPLDPDGFANLFFAALANVPADTPFFPAAYSGGDQNGFAVAVEAADLAVSAFSAATNFPEARSLLKETITNEGQRIAQAAGEVALATDIPFYGIDFSLAPYPENEKSLGKALELLGVPKLGDHGSTAAAAFLVDTVDQADFPRIGFSGLMLPVLEDAVLAQRAAEGSLTLKDLLLFSTVCGTGLDTIPLPGDLTSGQISAVLLDLSVLAIRLNKPLTARLMPIPGKKAGDKTSFDFPYFANSRVMALQAGSLKNLFQSDHPFQITPRKSL